MLPACMIDYTATLTMSCSLATATPTIPRSCTILILTNKCLYFEEKLTESSYIKHIKTKTYQVQNKNISKQNNHTKTKTYQVH